jgi:hypothetical protein
MQVEGRQETTGQQQQRGHRPARRGRGHEQQRNCDDPGHHHAALRNRRDGTSMIGRAVRCGGSSGRVSRSNTYATQPPKTRNGVATPKIKAVIVSVKIMANPWAIAR